MPADFASQAKNTFENIGRCLTAAGAKFALAVGEVLLISTVAAEALSIEKAGFNLVHGKQDEAKNEQDYEQIANSSIVMPNPTTRFKA